VFGGGYVPHYTAFGGCLLAGKKIKYVLKLNPRNTDYKLKYGEKIWIK
jgi:hypothetical protein